NRHICNNLVRNGSIALWRKKKLTNIWGPVCRVILSVLVRKRWRPTTPEQRLATHAAVMGRHALERSVHTIDLGEERLVLVDDGPVHELEERTHPCEVLKVFRDEERTSLKHEHPGSFLRSAGPPFKCASGAFVDLGSCKGAVHPGPDDNRVEPETTLLLRGYDFVNSVTHKARYCIEREGCL